MKKLIALILIGFPFTGFANDSTDIQLIRKYLFDKYGAMMATENKNPQMQAHDLWETGPFKIESNETKLAFGDGYRFYAVCSAVHGIPSPSFRKILMINPNSNIIEMRYDDHAIFNTCLKRGAVKKNMRMASGAIMKVLAVQFCMSSAFNLDEIKIVKKRNVYTCRVSKGEGYTVGRGPAYSWIVQFDKTMSCIQAKFECNLPPVP